jgi:GR25 family glycosyltransferase involved in LPS biosynthesis
MLDVNKVYMTHYSPLKDRKSQMIKTLPFDMEWFEQEPQDEYWTKDEQSWASKAPTVPFKNISRSEVSLAHKHIEAYKDIVKNKYQKSLILEDDVMIVENFPTHFNNHLTKTPSDWDFIFIGSGCGLRIPQHLQQPEQIAYRVAHPASKCTDSYCITYEAAQKILSTIIPFTFPIDFELNYQMELHDMNVYWWEPPLVAQGSQCGVFGSAIQGVQE